MKRLLLLALAVLVLALLLWTNSAAAADTGGIEGNITYDDHPASNATVQLKNEMGIVNTTTANHSGYFNFSNIPPGDYILIALYNGYNGSVNVSVESNKTTYTHFFIYIPAPDDDTDDDVDDDITPDDDTDDDVDDDVDDDISADDDNADAGNGTFLIFGFIILFIVVLVIIGIVIAYNYSKITHDRLMEHGTRMKIFEHIQKEPGQHLRKIGADLDLPMGVLTHHIGKLEKEEVIKFQLDGKFKRYYPWDSKIERKPWLSDIQNEIMAKVRSQPGISANDLMEAMGGSRSNTYYHIAELEGKGLIRVDRQEKKHRCYPVLET